jgi:hypothetical protein
MMLLVCVGLFGVVRAEPAAATGAAASTATAIHKPPPGARINWKHPLAGGLVSAVALSEGAGATFYDAATSQPYTARVLDGTPKGGLPPKWFVPPVTPDYPWVGPAISNNDATAQSIVCPITDRQFVQDVKGGYSYATLVQPLDEKTFGRILDGTGNAVITLYLNIGNHPGMVATTWRGADHGAINPFARFTPNKWMLVLCTVQQGLGVMYVNGKEAARDTKVDLPSSWAGQTGRLVYNATGNGAMMCNANFSSWWVWNNRVLTAQEAAQLYANPWSMFDPAPQPPSTQAAK